MPLVVSVSALVALATGSWTVLAVGAATEVFLLALLYGCLAYNFRNVSIDPELVAKHVGRYGQSEDDDARLKDKRREVLVGLALFSPDSHLAPGVPRRGADLL